MYVMVRSAPLAGCTVSPMPGNPICCSELMMSEGESGPGAQLLACMRTF
jgi:hypothetical protein